MPAHFGLILTKLPPQLGLNGPGVGANVIENRGNVPKGLPGRFDQIAPGSQFRVGLQHCRDLIESVLVL